MSISLLDSWEIHLASQNKSPTTIKSYLSHVRLYLLWCDETGGDLTRDDVKTHLADLIKGGSQANTVRLRLASLRAYTRWLVDEEEIPADPLIELKPPKVPVKVTEALTDDQLKALIKACQGRGFRDRRDEAIVRLMMETGIRASECVALNLADVNLTRGLVTIQKGKGFKGRIAPFGKHTAASLDRYIRMRKSHPLSKTPKLWLGVGGKTFGYFGLNDSLRDRAKTAGIEGFHLHLMRHTAATRWLGAGGSEQGLMSIAGWSSRSMLDRYTTASAAERALAESRNLGLGDLG